MEIRESTEVDLAAPSSYGKPRSKPHRSLSILVVDDDRDSADGLAMLLQRWKHHVRVAYDARGAMEIFREQLPDLVLLDIALPGGMDGYQLAVLLRSQEHQAVLIALTGYSDRRRALSAGFEEHFAKPLDPDALRVLLSRL